MSFLVQIHDKNLLRWMLHDNFWEDMQKDMDTPQTKAILNICLTKETFEQI